MRQELGLYANLRPVVAIPSLIEKSPLKNHLIEDVDFLVVRELTGGIYFGEPRGRSEDGKKAFDSCVYTVDEIERVAKKAFEFARTRNKKVTAVDKANVLATSRLWRETIQQLHNEYKDIELEFMFVDNAAMQIIQNPKAFDVIVTENMFGDILTDEASVITGSIGLLASASIGVHTSVYEPIHGSFPQAAGQNIANPVATILSAAMMLDYSFDLKKESELIEKAVEKSLIEGIVTNDLSTEKYYKTNEVGDWIVDYILKS
jgi:3-isopropylmalate dehydrogenase